MDEEERARPALWRSPSLGAEGIVWTDQWLMVPHDLRRWIWWKPAHEPRSGDPLASRRTRVSWSDLIRLSAVDPWPRLELRYHSAGGEHRLLLDPAEADRPRFGNTVRALFASAAALAPWKLDRGWLDHPDVSWEPALRWPMDLGEEVRDRGAFRTASSAQGERIVALRPPEGLAGSVLRWLRSSPEAPWGEQPSEAVLTERHLYVRDPEGEARRVALDSLRGVERLERHATYLFGRRLRVILHRPRDCPVARGLDSILAEKARKTNEEDALKVDGFS